VKTFGSTGMQIFGFTGKGIVTFTTSQMTDIPEPSPRNVYVSSSGIYILVTGLENVRNEEVTVKNADGQETKRTEKKGDSRDYIARFDRDGSYKGALKLDSDLHPVQLATFDSGIFVVAVVDPNKTPRVGLLNSSGQLLKFLQLPKDITDRQKSAEKSFAAASGQSASTDVIAMLSQFYSSNGNVLLIRAGNVTPIYEIRESGEVRPVRLKIPDGLTVDRLVPSDRNWFLVVREGTFADKSETIYEINPENGEPLRQYRIPSKSELEETISCTFQDGFVGISHRQGRLTVLHGVAEPAKQQASPVPQ
jgi:hypothetical protein